MRRLAGRLVQLVVVVILSTLFTFSLLRLFPGDVADAVIPFGTKAAEGSSSARTSGSTSRSSSSTPPGSATSCRATSARTTSRTSPVSDKLADRAAGVAPAHALRADPRAGRRDPARRVHRVPRRHQDRPRDQRRRVRAARAPELRARARARVLRRGEVATRHTLARPDPGRPDTSRAGSKALFGQPTGDLGKHFGTMLLPAISLAAGLIAVYMRLLRSDMIATLQENFITMAQGEGDVRTGASCGATRSGRRASPCSPSPASTSARSSAARSWSR